MRHAAFHPGVGDPDSLTGRVVRAAACARPRGSAERTCDHSLRARGSLASQPPLGYPPAQRLRIEASQLPWAHKEPRDSLCLRREPQHIPSRGRPIAANSIGSVRRKETLGRNPKALTTHRVGVDPQRRIAGLSKSSHGQDSADRDSAVSQEISSDAEIPGTQGPFDEQHSERDLQKTRGPGSHQPGSSSRNPLS